MSIEQDCLMWGYRVVIPEVYRAALLLLGRKTRTQFDVLFPYTSDVEPITKQLG